MTKKVKEPKAQKEPKAPKTEPKTENSGEELSAPPKADSEIISDLRAKYEATAKDMSHREYGLALESVVKALKSVESALKNVCHVEEVIQKRAAKAEKAKGKKD